MIIYSPEAVEDERVMRVMTNLVVMKRLELDVRSVYGHEIEQEYRRRYRRPSMHVREAMMRLIERGVIQRTGKPLDLYIFTPRVEATPSAQRSIPSPPPLPALAPTPKRRAAA